MVNALLGTVFLILVAVSAAVTGSMIVLALVDLAFGKKSRPPVVTEMMESDQLESPSKPKIGVAESKLKPKPLAAYQRGYLAKRSADPKASYGPQTQRVRHFDDELDPGPPSPEIVQQNHLTLVTSFGKSSHETVDCVDDVQE